MMIGIIWRCKNLHEWGIILAKYFANVPRCETCGEFADCYRFGSIVDSLKHCQIKPDTVTNSVTENG